MEKSIGVVNVSFGPALNKLDRGSELCFVASSSGSACDMTKCELSGKCRQALDHEWSEGEEKQWGSWGASAQRGSEDGSEGIHTYSACPRACQGSGVG